MRKRDRIQQWGKGGDEERGSREEGDGRAVRAAENHRGNQAGKMRGAKGDRRREK